MNPTSPFQYQRWEVDDHHIIWLPPEFKEWEGKRSVYFTGSRGSGKTTLLRAFEWNERLHNESLKKQIGVDPFERRYVGIYLSMPNYITNHFLNWPTRIKEMDSKSWEEEKGRLYSLYLEYQILQLFVKAINKLRVAGILKFSPNDELETVVEILSERPEIKRYLPNDSEECRLVDLGRSFKFLHERLRKHAIEKENLATIEQYPSLQMGQMLEEVTGFLLKLCSKGEATPEKGWILKVCIDQAESVEAYQQKAINTMVARLISGDVSFIIAASTRIRSLNDTFIPNHQLTDDDRIYTSLEKIYKKSKFNEFAKAVTELRFKNFLFNDDVSVDLKYILGDWPINNLLDKITFHNTESQRVKDFIKKAKSNMEMSFFKPKKDELEDLERENSQTNEDELDESLDEFLPREDSLDIPPYYQTYLIDKLGQHKYLEIADRQTVRSINSKNFRKKMVASMLCLCKEMGFNIPFAGYTMVMSLSDTCIRDYLRIMHEIYLIAETTAEDFIKKTIDPAKQNEAIRKASEIKYSGVGYEPEYRLSEIGRLIDSLGRITADIQSSYKDLSSLKNPERGIFEIDLNQLKSDKDEQELREIIRLAIGSHCIKITKNSIDEDKIYFRLHKLFAPKFNFSYRGAYYVVSLDIDILLDLCKENKLNTINDLELREINKITKFKNQASLDNWVI